LYWFDLFEKEPVLLLGAVFIWGAVVAAGSAFLINSILGLSVYVITGSEAATNLTTSALIAPIIEEILKGFAVFLVFLIFTHEFDSILDGIVYAGVTALGFAATENAYYIYTYGFLEVGWRVGGDPFGVICFDLLEPVQFFIKLAITDDRVVEDMIAVIMIANFFLKLLIFLF